MKKSLPARPNLEHLREQAKHLLSRLRAGDDEAARTFIEHLPAAKKLTLAQVKKAALRLADAQSAIARKSGFAAWPGLARHVSELRALEGSWQIAALEIDGSPVPAAMASQTSILLDGDRFRTESPDGVYEGIFSIDVETTPARMDIEFVEGPEAGNWSYGIYRLEKDDLTLCLGLVGASRPGAFVTRPGSGHALERLRRTSAARPANVTGGQPQTPVEAPAAAPVDESGFALVMTPLLAQLQGEWKPVALVSDGKALPESMLAFGSRTMTGNEMKVTFGGQVMLHAKVRLDASQQPVAVDYLNIGRGPKAVTHGIIDFRQGVLRVCMAPSGQLRPLDFTCEPGSGRTLSEWTRK